MQTTKSTVLNSPGQVDLQLTYSHVDALSSSDNALPGVKSSGWRLLMFLNYCTLNQWTGTTSHSTGVLFLSLDVGWTHSRMTPWCLLQLLCILCSSTEYTVSYVQLLQIATMRVQ